MWNLQTFSLYLDGECDLVVTIGKGFFSRSVCAVSFSSDDTYLACIGCDDHHSMGIWYVHQVFTIPETATAT